MRRASRHEPDVNRTYHDLATHYGTVVAACPPPVAPGQGEGGSGGPERRTVGSGAVAQPPGLLAEQGSARRSSPCWRRSTSGRSSRPRAAGAAYSTTWTGPRLKPLPAERRTSPSRTACPCSSNARKAERAQRRYLRLKGPCQAPPRRDGSKTSTSRPPDGAEGESVPQRGPPEGEGTACGQRDPGRQEPRAEADAGERAAGAGALSPQSRPGTLLHK